MTEKAPRCPVSGRKVSVPHDVWAEADTATCPGCGATARWNLRATDLPPWGRIHPHRTDGTPTR
jgi:hypothetical protein